MKEGRITLLMESAAITATSRLEILQVYKLLQCVRQENTFQITKLCAQGIPMLVNHRDPEHGQTALHLAAESNKDDMIKFLLELGAHPNVQDFKGRTPVMIAADYGHDKTVEILAEAGADMTVKDKNGQDILFYCLSAPTNRHRLCLEIALAYGADVNNTFESKIPTLVSACESSLENERMCLMLVEKGANPDAVNKINGKCALSAASFSGSATVVRALLKKGASPNNPDKQFAFPVHYAAQKGVLESVKALAAYGGDMTVSDKLNNNALHHAAEGGFAMVCKYLGQRGCNPKQKNADGFTPRLLAKEKSFKEASKELRKAEKTFTKYSKPGMKNPNEPEVLNLYDWACERAELIKEMLMKVVIPLEPESTLKGNLVTRQDFDEIVEELKAPISQHMKKRFYELHDKERKGVVDIDEFLSGKKYISKAYLMSAFEGKKKKKGKKGKGKKGKKGKLKIPVPICTEKDGPRRPDGGPPYKYIEKQVLWTDRLRFNRDKPPKHPLQDDSAWYLQQPDKLYINIIDVVKSDDMETLQRAFENGVHVDTRDKYFKTPLMTSCAEGNLTLTNYLLSLGASVDARDNFRWTPLHHACHSGQLDVVKSLLYAGAEGNAVTWNGATPLMRAIESGKTEVVKFLLECNVNMLFTNKKEKTALDVARDWGGTEIYHMVKEKYDAAPKPKKDKNGKMKIPPVRPLTLPPLELELGSTMPDATNEKMEGSRPITAENKNISEQARPYTPTLPLDDSNNIKTVSYTSQALELFGKKPDTTEDVVFTPQKTWVEQQTTTDLLDARQKKRDRYGHEVDFDTYEKPLKQNISAKIREFENSQS